MTAAHQLTHTQLIGDAAVGSALPALTAISSLALSWPALNSTYLDAGLTSFALVLDDLVVEANSTRTSTSLTQLSHRPCSCILTPDSDFSLADVSADLATDHYFRIAVSPAAELLPQ